MQTTWRVISREGEGRRWSTGNKKHKWQVQNRQGEVKNSMGNGEAEKLLCTTHDMNKGMGGVQGGEA